MQNLNGIVAASSQVYISTVMMFGKIMNALMFFRLIPVMGVFYVILCVCKFMRWAKPLKNVNDFSIGMTLCSNNVCHL